MRSSYFTSDDGLDLTDDDPSDRLLLINDLINNVTKRYESFKGGDRSATADIDPA